MAENYREENLFAFAGIDGAGKTTLINSLALELHSSGLSVFVSKAYADDYKSTFSHMIATADDIEIMFMFQAFQRRQRNNAIARLAMGDVVLADRWNETFEAYHSQNGILSNNQELRREIDFLSYEGLLPNLTMYIRTDPLISIKRTAVRGADYFDAKSLEYHEKQTAFYDNVAEYDDTWVILDGHLSPNRLTEQAIEIIEPLVTAPKKIIDY